MDLLATLFALYVAAYGGDKEAYFPPVAEYYNYWSGEKLTDQDLAGKMWDVVETEKFINLRDQDESETYEVHVSRFGTTSDQPVFFVGEFKYGKGELEGALSEGYLD